MSKASNTKIELTEIADYRGNLSFAEEHNPIPFDIKSVFWTTINEDVELDTDSQSFVIVLSGEAAVNNELLNKPNLAYLGDGETKLHIELQSKEAIILIVMDKEIMSPNNSTEHKNNILEMPTTDDFCGLKGYFANSNTTLPFNIKRVYFTYSIPDFARRGGHAHIYTKEIVFPIKGEFDVIVEQNKDRKSVHLNTENQGIFLNTGIWRELENFTDQSLVLVLASETYYEEDYIRKYEEYSVKY